MIIYFLVISTSIIFAILAEKNRKNKTYFYTCYFISFIILFLFSGLRYKVGYDYEYTYLPGYYSIKNGYESRFEILFVLLNKLVYYVFNNVDWLFILCSFITMRLVYKAIKQNSVDVGISIILLFSTRFYFYSFTQVRQYIAIAIFLYSIKYIIKKDFKKYLILILIAYGFHKTAIIYLPIYFVNKINLSRRKYILIALSSALLNPIIQKLYYFFGTYLYSGYIEKSYGEANSSIVMIATVLVLSIIAICYYNKLVKNDKGRILLNLQLVLMILTVTISNINESYRILGMFMYSSIFLIPECYKLATKNQKIIIVTILLGMAVFASYLTLTYGEGTMLPYRTIFNKEL